MSGADHSQGVRLLSHRPSVLFKLEHHNASAADVADGGIVISGPGWGDRLRDALDELSHSERACVFAVRLDDDHDLPLPAKTLLDRSRTDWFPKFLSTGELRAVFQPIVDLKTGAVFGREALLRARLGGAEVRAAEIREAAEAHDAIFSLDTRARAAALTAGLPALPAGEVLFTDFDPRGVPDVETSVRSLWTLVERLEAPPACVGLEIGKPERFGDAGLLAEIVAAHREKGAVIALDDLTAGAGTLELLETLRPDVAKLDGGFARAIEGPGPRRHLVSALVEVARDVGCRIAAVDIERDSQLEALVELGVELGQGSFLAHPNEEMLPVDPGQLQRAAVA